MWECRACMLRCFRAIIESSAPSARIAHHRPALLAPRRIRQFATVVRPRRLQSETTRDDVSTDLASTKSDEEKLQAKDHDRALRKELQFLKDPVKLAEHVHYVLRCDKREKALELCRMASKTMDCVVSWNHVVDWHMQRGRAAEAIKIYNEMKKRAQFPDTYTYMALLRGFPATRTHHGAEVKAEMVSKAVSIYQGMNSPNSRVKPGIMHTNAVLRVCALAKDVDALWSIAAQIPERGSGSADHITYSILLSAIRHSALGMDDGAVDQDQLAKRRQHAVNEGRRVWMEVITKWRSGEVAIDGQLICEMGNLLLISTRIEDWDDVLNLVQQTTNIERKLPHLGSQDRHTGHVPREESSAEVGEDSEGWVQTPAANAFKAVQPHARDSAHPKRATTLAFVPPDNAILSVLISACTRMYSNKAAFAYWDCLVHEHGVKPDTNNFHTLLKLHSINRSDKQAAALLYDMSTSGLEMRNMTFRMAFAACTRNWKNANVLASADRMLDVMQTSLPSPDPQTLCSYLSLALKTDDGRKMEAALDRMDPFVQVLRSRVDDGAAVVEQQSPSRRVADLEDMQMLHQTMVGVIDTLMNRDLFKKEALKDWHARRTQLTTYVGRLKNVIEGLRAQVEQSPRRPKDTPDERYRRASTRGPREQVAFGRRPTADERPRGRRAPQEVQGRPQRTPVPTFR